MSEAKRLEIDSLGEMQVPENALFGIHSVRAAANFPDRTPFHPEWYRAMGTVKEACYLTYSKYKSALLKKQSPDNLAFELIDDIVLDALENAAREVSEGKYFDQFIVPAISGGAGTSINMNVNEIISNVALLHSGHKPGEYKFIDPIEAANIYQSTNDVVPTALKVAAMKLLTKLEESINSLRQEIEYCEKQYRNELRIGYTQMQEAVPSSYGKLFSTYSEALSRDWWRVSKCFERIKVVNLGGGAIGTGIAIPKFFIMEVVGELQKISGLPVTRSENLPDTTANLDVFVEVHAILKSLAVNLEKLVSDLRLLASSVVGKYEIKIPSKQVGSSIMPGKVNPVIPEYIVSVSHKVYANDQLISSLCAQGCLDLNAYVPLIGHSLLASLKLLIGSCTTVKENLIKGIVISKGGGETHLYSSASITTALSPVIGYHKAALLAKEMKVENCSVFEANDKLKLIDNEQLKRLLSADRLLKTGFTLEDLE